MAKNVAISDLAQANFFYYPASGAQGWNILLENKASCRFQYIWFGIVNGLLCFSIFGRYKNFI